MFLMKLISHSQLREIMYLFFNKQLNIKMINKIKMIDNISFKKEIWWYDINEGGYVKGCLNIQTAGCLFKKTANETRYYRGSSINLINILSSLRSRIVNKDKYCINTSIFYNCFKIWLK